MGEIKKFSFESALMPIVKVTYQGKPLSLKFYNEHPEIHQLYPTKQYFMKQLYLPLLECSRKTNTQQLLEISENAVIINGVAQ